MRTRFKRKLVLVRISLHLLGLGFLAYFMYHSVTGDFGSRSGKEMEQKIAVLQAENAKLYECRNFLETRVRLMKDGTLDADMLDERARSLLAVSRSDEITIYYDHTY